MSMELIAIISVGVMLAGISLNGQHNQRADMQALREEMNGLRGVEWVAGRSESFTGAHGAPGRTA